jgi:hypothetical protein
MRGSERNSLNYKLPHIQGRRGAFQERMPYGLFVPDVDSGVE